MLSMKSLPRLSLNERDRRWATVRKEMATRGLDAIVLWGWPMMWDFYRQRALSLPDRRQRQFNVLIFPATGEPTSIIQMPTFVAGWNSAQEWVSDIRPSKSWADLVGEPAEGAQARRRQDRHGRSTPARSTLTVGCRTTCTRVSSS